MLILVILCYLLILSANTQNFILLNRVWEEVAFPKLTTDYFLVINLGLIGIQVKGLPYNSYTWLTTHNSFARLGVRSETGGIILAPQNQQDSVTDQLNVRHLIFTVSFLYAIYFVLMCMCAVTGKLWCSGVVGSVHKYVVRLVVVNECLLGVIVYNF